MCIAAYMPSGRELQMASLLFGHDGPAVAGAGAVDRPHQLVRSVEIIVVSDGSTDRTAEIAQGFDGVQVIVFEGFFMRLSLKREERSCLLLAASRKCWSNCSVLRCRRSAKKS